MDRRGLFLARLRSLDFWLGADAAGSYRARRRQRVRLPIERDPDPRGYLLVGLVAPVLLFSWGRAAVQSQWPIALAVLPLIAAVAWVALLVRFLLLPVEGESSWRSRLPGGLRVGLALAVGCAIAGLVLIL